MNAQGLCCEHYDRAAPNTGAALVYSARVMDAYAAKRATGG